ncbi:MAG TPA: hypothetical protein VGQ81_15250 [Acidobacteriota bacterium]|jgi:hypothetical protein|nr:hypothetical protein [Acidobacteriota bacterium]
MLAAPEIRRGFLNVFFLSLLCTSGLIAQNVSAQELIFPVFARTEILLNPNIDPMFSDVDAFHSEFQIINPNPSAVRVTFHVFDTAGNEVLPLGSKPISRIVDPNAIAGGIGFRFPQRAVVGWVKAVSTQPVVIQEEISHSQDHDRPGPPSTLLKSRIVKWPAKLTRRAVIRVRFVPAESFGGDLLVFENTGVSIVFPSSISGLSTRGILLLRDQIGAKFGQREISISPNGQVVQNLTELFPEVNRAFSGTLDITFDNDVYATAIQIKVGLGQEAMDEPNNGAIP